MPTTLNNYRLAAAILLVKAKCVNGIIDISKPEYLQAKEIGLSVQSYRKYKHQAMELGLLRVKSYYLRTISWQTIIRKLGIVDKNRKFKSFIDKKDISKMSIHQLSEWIYQCAILWHASQQQFKISRKEQLISSAKRYLANPENIVSKKHFARIKKLAKQQYISFKECCEDLVKDDYIKVGCYNLANKLGLSHNTANRSLNKLHNDNFIVREIIRLNLRQFEVNHYNFDNLKYTLGLKVFVKGGMFQITLGSKITILVNNKS